MQSAIDDNGRAGVVGPAGRPPHGPHAIAREDRHGPSAQVVRTWPPQVWRVIAETIGSNGKAIMLIVVIVVIAAPGQCRRRVIRLGRTDGFRLQWSSLSRIRAR